MFQDDGFTDIDGRCELRCFTLFGSYGHSVPNLNNPKLELIGIHMQPTWNMVNIGVNTVKQRKWATWGYTDLDVQRTRYRWTRNDGKRRKYDKVRPVAGMLTNVGGNNPRFDTVLYRIDQYLPFCTDPWTCQNDR